MNVFRQAVAKWEGAQAAPNLDKILQLSELFGVSETIAGVVGLVTLLVVVAIAVAIFISCGFRNAPYAFLNRDEFEAEYGVKGMVKEKQKAFQSTYAKCNIIGTCLCIITPVPLLIASFTEHEVLLVGMLSLLLLLVGVGTICFIVAGVRWVSVQKLLMEGGFSKREKQKSKRKEQIGTIYWLAATAVYLGWSFLADSWKTS